MADLDDAIFKKVGNTDTKICFVETVGKSDILQEQDVCLSVH